MIGLVIILIFVGFFQIFRKWIQGPEFSEEHRAEGKVVIITGGNTGIGKQTAIELAKRGATVYIACRCLERGEAAKKDIIAASGSDKVILKQLNLASFKCIRKFAEEFKNEHARLHILINNAAVMSYDRKLTEDGLESHMGVNHLGHFLLTNLLLDLLKDSAPSRVINVSSTFHHGDGIDKDDLMCANSYGMFKAYGRSKVANILFNKELSRRLSGTKVSTFALHPGVVDTEISRDIGNKWKPLQAPKQLYAKYFMKTVAAGAQTTIFCALEPGLEQHSGEFFVDFEHVHNATPSVNDEEMCKWLWDQSEKLTNISKKQE